MPLLQGLGLQHKIMGNTAVLMVRLAPKHFEFLQARKQGRSVVALEAQLFSYIALHPKMPLPEGLRLQHKISLGTESTFQLYIYVYIMVTKYGHEYSADIAH